MSPPPRGTEGPPGEPRKSQSLDEGFLSAEELSALLEEATESSPGRLPPASHDAPGHSSPTPQQGEEVGAEAPRILFLARRGDSAELVALRLEAAGARVVRARNPFALLDLLRATAPSALVSDLEPWANEGALLRERLALHAPGAPVLWIIPEGGGGDALGRRLLASGAWGVLLRPIDAGDAQAAASALLEAIRQGCSGGASVGSTSRPVASLEEPCPPAAPGPATEPVDPAPREPLARPPRDEAGGLPGDPGKAEDESRWLRLHVALWRVGRGSSPPAERALCAVRAAVDTLDAEGAVIVVRDAQGRTWSVGEGAHDSVHVPALGSVAPQVGAAPPPSSAPLTIRGSNSPVTLTIFGAVSGAQGLSPHRGQDLSDLLDDLSLAKGQ